MLTFYTFVYASSVTHSWSRFHYTLLITRGSTGREILI